jgi:hypothetical protein
VKLQEMLKTQKPDKVEVIQNAGRPCDVRQLRAFVGLVNYYGRFMHNISTVMTPVYALLYKERQWECTNNCEESFKRLKTILWSAPVPSHNDVNKETVLDCDASYG